MRKLMLLAAVFGLAGSLWAADPIIGTWKLNIAKSKFGPGVQATMKEQTNTLRELTVDQCELAITGIGTNGSPYSMKLTFPMQGGGPAVVTAQPPAIAEGVSVVVTFVEPGNWYFTDLKNGKQVAVAHVVVSKDGKSALETNRSTDATGKTTEQLLVYDKQ
jgi:hypothetical protein